MNGLLESDPFFVLADFASYSDCQDQVTEEFRQTASWTRKSILNTARMGRFSSDRTVKEYARDIWGVGPMPVVLDP